MLRSYVDVVQQPCVGLSDGVIRFSIPNPFNDLVLLYVNGFPIPLNGGNPVYVEVGGLPNGDCLIDLTIGNCSSSITYEIMAESPEKTFNKLEGENCIYDRTCNGINYGQVTIPRLQQTGNMGYSIKGCKIRKVCPRGESEEFVKAGREMMRYWKARLIVDRLYNMGQLDLGSYELSKVQIGDVDSEKQRCKRVRMCKSNVNKISKWPGSGPQNCEPESIGGGCSVLGCGVFCSGLIKSTFCETDVLEFVHGEIRGQDLTTCNLRSGKIWEVLNARENGEFGAFSNFLGSPLDIFLNDYSMSNPVTRCASVGFCLSDFTILFETTSTTDMSPIGLTYPGYFDGNNYETFCHCNSTSLCAVFLYDDWSPEFTSGEPSIAKYVTSIGNEKMINLTKITLDNVSMPKAVVKLDSSLRLYEFDEGNGIREIKDEGNLLFLDENWDLDHLSGIYELDSLKKYEVFFEDS